MIRLLHDVRQTKRTAVLISVYLKDASDRVRSEKVLQFLNSKDLPSEWIPYLSHVMLNRRLKIVSRKQSRFSLATCLRRLATRPYNILYALRLVLG